MKIQSAYKSEKARRNALAVYDKILEDWPAPYQSINVNTSFGETHILVSGASTNKPLLLLHGGGGNSTMWRDNIASLSRHFHIYAVDIIGEAGKSAGTRPETISEYSHWLKQV